MSDKDQVTELAKLFHETYERLAPDFGYETRKESRKKWSDVPVKNRNLMIAVAAHILAELKKQPEPKLSAVAIPCPDECGGILEVKKFIDRPTCNKCGKVFRLCRKPCPTLYDEKPEPTDEKQPELDAETENQAHTKPCPYNKTVACVQYPDDGCGCDPCEECEVKRTSQQPPASKTGEVAEFVKKIRDYAKKRITELQTACDERCEKLRAKYEPKPEIDSDWEGIIECERQLIQSAIEPFEKLLEACVKLDRQASIIRNLRNNKLVTDEQFQSRIDRLAGEKEQLSESWDYHFRRGEELEGQVEKLQTEIKGLKIRLEESRKLGKSHRDRELANAKKGNEYYEQIKQLQAENATLDEKLGCMTTNYQTHAKIGDQFQKEAEQLQAEIKGLKETVVYKDEIIVGLNKRLSDIGAQC